MPPRLKAILLLALYLLKTVGRRIFTRNKSGIATFRSNYDADGLPPVSPAERAAMPALSRCIACGLSARGKAASFAAAGGAYRGVIAPMLAGARSTTRHSA